MLEQAETALETAQASLQAAQARRGDRVIRAPFSGRVGLTTVTPGTLVNPGAVIATLDDVSTIRVDFPLPERYLNLLRPGTTITATAPACTAAMAKRPPSACTPGSAKNASPGFTRRLSSASPATSRSVVPRTDRVSTAASRSRRITGDGSARRATAGSATARARRARAPRPSRRCHAARTTVGTGP